MASTLVSEVSDHTPCLLQVETEIPRGNNFRFEYYWMEHEWMIMQVVNHGWSLPTFQMVSAKNLMAKFKNLRRVLKVWQKHISSIMANIANVKAVLSAMEILEEHRDLTVEEWNFKDLLSEKLLSLLHQQKVYWKERGTIRWVKFGDASTQFFHATATIRHRKNMITMVKKCGWHRSLQSHHRRRNFVGCLQGNVGYN